MGILIGSYLGRRDVGAFALDVDIHLTGPDDGPPVSIRTGFEKAISKFYVDTGYRWEGPSREHWLNFGIGMNERNTGLHYALSVPLHPKPWDPLAITHMISFQVAGIGGGAASEQPSGFFEKGPGGF